MVLSQDAVCLGPDGQPWSGVSLKSEQARALAARLLALVKEIEKQQHLSQRSSLDSLASLSSILVFHDGSEQSHRAFRLALDFATRSLARIEIAAIFGVQPTNKFEPSTSPDDYEWQRGWLERLTSSYPGQAAKEGVELRNRFIAANDNAEILAMFESGRFDLIIVPCQFSDHANESGSLRGLMQSLAEPSKSKILFCP